MRVSSMLLGGDPSESEPAPHSSRRCTRAQRATGTGERVQGVRIPRLRCPLQQAVSGCPRHACSAPPIGWSRAPLQAAR